MDVGTLFIFDAEDVQPASTPAFLTVYPLRLRLSLFLVLSRSVLISYPLGGDVKTDKLANKSPSCIAARTSCSSSSLVFRPTSSSCGPSASPRITREVDTRKRAGSAGNLKN